MSKKIDRIAAVIGLGTMGHGIVQTFALAGHTVHAYDPMETARATLHDRIRDNLQRFVDAELMRADDIPQVIERIRLETSEVDAVKPASFVTEAVAEDLTVKQELFQRLEEAAAPETILASNTSSYPMTDIASRLQRPERAVVTHWFNPPHIVPIVEVVPGEKTSPETIDRTCDMLFSIGKEPVRLNREIPGFLVNRIQVAMFREIWDLLDRGIASAEDIDRAVCGSIGLRLAAMGPLEIIDFAGWDITSRVYSNLAPHLRADTELPDTVKELIEAGHFGVKSGRGVFTYDADAQVNRTRQRDDQYLGLLLRRTPKDSRA